MILALIVAWADRHPADHPAMLLAQRWANNGLGAKFEYRSHRAKVYVDLVVPTTTALDWWTP